VVDTDEKGRYQIEGGMIRATYGHSIDLDLDLPMDDIPDELYYPVTAEELDLILEAGLKPSDRKEVHLSKTPENALEAGRHRVGQPLLIAVDTAAAISDGYLIKRAGTTVYTTKEVPDQYLRSMEELNRDLMDRYEVEKEQQVGKVQEAEKDGSGDKTGEGEGENGGPAEGENPPDEKGVDPGEGD
jgi:putative RNA 2'-phosphotransferase